MKAACVPSAKFPEVPATAEQEGARLPRTIFSRCVALAPEVESQRISLIALCRLKASQGVPGPAVTCWEGGGKRSPGRCNRLSRSHAPQSTVTWQPRPQSPLPGRVGGLRCRTALRGAGRAAKGRPARSTTEAHVGSHVQVPWGLSSVVNTGLSFSTELLKTPARF